MKITALLVLKCNPDGSDAIILANACDVSHFGYFQRSNVKQFIVFGGRTIATRTPPGQRQSVQHEEYKVHSYNRNGLCALGFMDDHYPVRSAFSLLNQVLDEYQKNFGESWKTARADNNQPWPYLDEALTKFQDPAEADKLLKIQRELDETKIILHKTIDSVLARVLFPVMASAPSDEISQIISQTALLSCEEISLELDPVSELGVNATNLSLVGKIVADKVVNVMAIKAVINRAWGMKHGVSISNLAPNTFRFGFYNSQDRSRALNTGPWSISGYHLVVKEWLPHLVLDEIDLTVSSFWVQAHGLPPDRMSIDNVYKIGALIGKVLMVDKPASGSLLWRKFVRFKVEFNVWDPLKTGFVLKRIARPDVWIQFKYERLSDFCYRCGRLSHVSKACILVSPVGCELDGSVCQGPLAFGPWLRAEYSDCLTGPPGMVKDHAGISSPNLPTSMGSSSARVLQSPTRSVDFQQAYDFTRRCR
ncbi:hypothetical protein L1049_022432 [Liquidambar formosana]|uniref:CCHC-type domain-containing protein n=1 Tax=Liquidambar formosana TaxID=63359 RepID=A0AAP0WQ63_LIQFO